MAAKKTALMWFVHHAKDANGLPGSGQRFSALTESPNGMTRHWISSDSVDYSQIMT
jgi:hypothetical protein